MSEHPVEHAPRYRRMAGRDRGEPHRVVSPLELFFDLCFVVAVAQVSAQLHHFLTEGHVAAAVLSYALVFFAIWWAWMNFSWFASAYDTDDVPYRVAVLVVITGALVLAAGVPRAFDRYDFTVLVIGYTIMRLALISLWLRAARSNPTGRATATRYAAGLAVSQALWIGWLFLPTSWHLPLIPPLVLIDVAVPIWAERTGGTAWHPRHIAERYGLFTLIVLGESVLAATLAVQSSVDSYRLNGRLLEVAAGGLLTVFALWWLYYAKPAQAFLTRSNGLAFLWGYGHYFVLAAAAAVGAGIAVNIDAITQHTRLSHTATALTTTLPVAVFLITLWFLQIRPLRVGLRPAGLFPVGALLVLATVFTAVPVLATGVILVALVATGILLTGQHTAD